MQDKMWKEFLVDVPVLGFTTPLCGLCGNTGHIPPRTLVSPVGVGFHSPGGPCICPNGRAIKGAVRQ